MHSNDCPHPPAPAAAMKTAVQLLVACLVLAAGATAQPVRRARAGERAHASDMHQHTTCLQVHARPTTSCQPCCIPPCRARSASLATSPGAGRRWVLLRGPAPPPLRASPAAPQALPLAVRSPPRTSHLHPFAACFAGRGQRAVFDVSLPHRPECHRHREQRRQRRRPGTLGGLPPGWRTCSASGTAAGPWRPPPAACLPWQCQCLRCSRPLASALLHPASCLQGLTTIVSSGFILGQPANIKVRRSGSGGAAAWRTLVCGCGRAPCTPLCAPQHRAAWPACRRSVRSVALSPPPCATAAAAAPAHGLLFFLWRRWARSTRRSRSWRPPRCAVFLDGGCMHSPALLARWGMARTGPQAAPLGAAAWRAPRQRAGARGG